jgi:SpoIIAA-like
MIVPIHDMPQGALGFEAQGMVTLLDQESVLEATMEAALAETPKLRLLYVTGEDFAGYDLGMMLDNTVFGTRHFADFERIAFVTDRNRYEMAVRSLDGLMPADLRLFGPAEIAAAKHWLT